MFLGFTNRDTLNDVAMMGFLLLLVIIFWGWVRDPWSRNKSSLSFSSSWHDGGRDFSFLFDTFHTDSWFREMYNPNRSFSLIRRIGPSFPPIFDHKNDDDVNGINVYRPGGLFYEHNMIKKKLIYSIRTSTSSLGTPARPWPSFVCSFSFLSKIRIVKNSSVTFLTLSNFSIPLFGGHGKFWLIMAFIIIYFD